MSAHPLSAAIEALAISLFETRGLAYGLDRRWHALSPSAQGEYQGLAIEVLRKLKPGQGTLNTWAGLPQPRPCPRCKNLGEDATGGCPTCGRYRAQPPFTAPTSDTTTTDYFRLMVDLSCAHTERVRKGIFRDQRPIITPKEQP